MVVGYHGLWGVGLIGEEGSVLSALVSSFGLGGYEGMDIFTAISL